MAHKVVTSIAAASAYKAKPWRKSCATSLKASPRLSTNTNPIQLAIEQVFMHKNAASALKLGHARGVALVAGQLRGLAVHEYTATQIKQAITGRGRGTKKQVQHMIKVLLSLSGTPQQDASDALAVALCHAHTQGTLVHVDIAKRRALL